MNASHSTGIHLVNNVMKKRSVLLIGMFFLLTACSKTGEEGVHKILSSSEPPVGVVFEIASDDDEGLNWAIPLVRSYAKQLRSKFPGIKLAVVSHGDEQFQLTENNRLQYADTHKQVASLIKDQGVEVHVCGNFAASYDIDENQFVDFIDVAARAPTRVKSYKDAGYELIFIRKPASVSN